MGNRGAAEVFSLHATKLLNGFEGGLVATDDAAFAAAVASSRNFGFRGQDTIGGDGTNAKLSEVHAALALRHLKLIDETIARYRGVARARAAARESSHTVGRGETPTAYPRRSRGGVESRARTYQRRFRPRSIRLGAAASPRPRPPRNIRVAAAAASRAVSTGTSLVEANGVRPQVRGRVRSRGVRKRPRLLERAAPRRRGPDARVRGRTGAPGV